MNHLIEEQEGPCISCVLGIINGVLISIPIWGLVCLLFYAIHHK